MLNDKGFENYLLRDSYGPIYFDPYAKRYLRVARSSISKADVDAKIRIKKQHLIIFDDQFKIIGESPVNDSMYLHMVFFTKEGNIYARTNAKDEYALHFVRLVYNDKKDNPVELTRNGKK